MDVNEIINDESYKDICKRISNNSSQWEDLYQEFILKVLDPKNKHKLDGSWNIKEYCYVIIHNLWYDRRMIKNHADTNTSSLYTICDHLHHWSNYNEDQQVKQQSPVEKELIRSLQIELNKLLKSDNKRTVKQARLMKMFCSGMNRLEISKEMNINYKIVYESIEEITNRIKYTMTGVKTITKNDITIKLRAEGGKPVYSGKEKTFYSENCSDETKDMIIKAGFKVCKK